MKTIEHEMEYTLADGRAVTIHYEAEYTIVDNGIGAYEYWGAKGTDVQLDTECEESTVQSVYDEEGNCIWNTLSKEEQKAIDEATHSDAIENCPEVEDCGDDGDYDEDRPDPRDWD